MYSLWWLVQTTSSTCTLLDHATVDVPIVDDQMDEMDESFSVYASLHDIQ